MNIFVLDKNPKKCARYHCNRHVVKMILESAQMLCTTHHLLGKKAPYKKTHANHPCNIWVRESKANYKWLCKMSLWLCKEYTYRYGKQHKSEKVIRWALENTPKLSHKGLTPFAQAMPEEYKSRSAVKAYRTLYRKGKKHLLDYKRRPEPNFI